MALRAYLDLTKFGIVVFVLLTGIAGYAAGFRIEQNSNLIYFLKLLGGLYFLSSGSLALNQVQEHRLDQKMPRTAQRPIAAGKIRPMAGAILSISMLVVGIKLLFELTLLTGFLGLLSVFLYNFLYTLYLKPKWIYAAVPGAIPGALPVTIGYSAANPEIFNPESVYLFLIMFLWQMPHFWSLAVKFKNDYAAADIPTLPVALGLNKTLYQIGLYTFVYCGLAIASPWFVYTNWLYLGLVVPMSFIILRMFFIYQRSHGEKGWFPFFMAVNISLLVYLFVPVIEKWALVK